MPNASADRSFFAFNPCALDPNRPASSETLDFLATGLAPRVSANATQATGDDPHPLRVRRTPGSVGGQAFPTMNGHQKCPSENPWIMTLSLVQTI